MKKVLFVLVLALSVVALTAVGAYAQPTNPPPNNVGTVTLTEQNGSGENGSVVFAETPAGLSVTVVVSNGTAEPQPAHIHKGTCAALDPKPLYPLNDVVNGQSQTTLPITMADLMGGDYAVNVHKSHSEAGIYVSCGDLSTLTRGGGVAPGAGGTTSPGVPTTPGMPTTGDNSLLTWLSVLAVVALGLIAVGARLAWRKS